jgi:mRNA interferase YafQ
MPLDPRLRGHALKGEFVGRRECHVEPDWLLVYKREPGIATPMSTLVGDSK